MEKTPENKERREYFYQIDEKGGLYHENSELTDKKFLSFFFRQLTINDTGAYPDFPFLSPCGREYNFVKCIDRPIIYRRLENDSLLDNGGAHNVFNPGTLRFSPGGKLYHPAPVGDFGALDNQLTIELGRDIFPWGPWYILNYKKQSYVISPMAGLPDTLRFIAPRAENQCFGCGGGHPAGLGLSFLYHREKQISLSWFTPDEFLQGAPGWMHGGFASLLLDEIMSKVLSGLEVRAPTANLNVNFRKPCRLGRRLMLRGRLEKKERRKHYLRGEILDIEDLPAEEHIQAYLDPEYPGVLLSEASALFIALKNF